MIQDRTVDALMAFIKSRLAEDEHFAQMQPQEQIEHQERKAEQKDDHPGCMMAGFLLVNRYVM